MSEDLPREDRTVIRGFVDRDDGAFDVLWRRFGSRTVTEATRLIRRLRIDEVQFDAEAAVDIAFFKVSQARYRHELDSIEDEEDFWKVLFVTLRRVIMDERVRSTAAKHRSHRRTNADLDQFISRQPPAEDIVATNIDFEALLNRVPDQICPTILAMCAVVTTPSMRSPAMSV